MPRNIILTSFKESLSLIQKNKLLFILLFVLQIIFFAILSYLNLVYQTKILENAKAITDYLSQQKLDELSVTEDLMQQKNILGDDPLTISRNFNEIRKNFRFYLTYVFLLFIIFISTNWAITNKLIYKINLKQSIKVFLEIFIITSFYLVLIFAFFFSLFNISLTEFAAEGTQLLTKYAPFLILSIILVYFMFVSISLLHKVKLKNIVQKTLSIGIKKIHYIAAVYFINLSLIAISIILLIYFIEKNLFVLLLSILLMIFSFVFGRVFMVKVVEKLDEQ